MNTSIKLFTAAAFGALMFQTPAVSAQDKKAGKDTAIVTRQKHKVNGITKGDKGQTQRITVHRKGKADSTKGQPHRFTMHTYAKGDTTKGQSFKLENKVVILTNGKRYDIKGDEMAEAIKIEINGDSVVINGEPATGSVQFNAVMSEGTMRLNAINALRDMNFNLDLPDIVQRYNGSVFLGVATELVENGAKIIGITKGSGAEKAGLKEGDIITAINNIKISSPQDLQTQILSYNAGNVVVVGYIRDKKQSEVKAELQQQLKDKSVRYFNIAPPDFPIKFSTDGSLQLTHPQQSGNLRKDNKNYKELLPQREFVMQAGTGQKWGLTVQETADKNGVQVLEVEKNSLAEKAGIQKNDIILNYKEKSINDIAILSSLMQFSRPGETVKILLSRKGKQLESEVKIPVILKTRQL